VLVTDFIQFGIAMTGSFAAAYFALQQPEVGGLANLIARTDPSTLALVPDFGDWSLTLTVLIIPLTIQWWSVWYPGAEPGGGSYIAQRMLAAKSENDALKGTLFFNFAHYALRPWPWIIVALASILVYPQLSDIARTFPNVDPSLIGHDMAYPAMLRFLPVGWLGLMVAGLLAAYVSTIATHLNWGTSYLVNDLYRRFMKPGMDDRHYVGVGRLVTAALMVIAASLTYVLDTATESFQLLLSIGAGTGLLYLLRWFWWRVNAYSEIAAMAASFVVSLGLFIARKNGLEMASHVSLIWTVVITTLVWITTTLVTAPTDRAKLTEFYRLVRPAGPGWDIVRKESGLPPSPDSMANSVLGWVLGCLFVYAALFGTGSYIYGRTAQGLMWTIVFVVCAVGLWRLLSKMWGTPEPAGKSPESRGQR
jgi:Na+/proline symporter